MSKEIFKKCLMCSTEWEPPEMFFKDKSLHIDGYGADFKNIEKSLFYFTHRKEGCFSTIVIKAKEVLYLYSGKRYSERRAGMEDCHGYCLDKKQLNRCDVLCECALNREVIQIIKDKYRS